jgi:RNA polymerase sigma-70 factor (ECF subfamily)
MEPALLARFDASDVVQETEMEAFRRLPDYLARKPMPFRLWLRKMAIERLLDLRRRHVEAARRSLDLERRLPDRSSCELAQRFVDRQLTPAENIEKQELAGRIRQAIARLSVEDQEILLMRYVEGFSNQEVAHLLELAPDAASKRHGRALLRLQRQLRRSNREGA